MYLRDGKEIKTVNYLSKPSCNRSYMFKKKEDTVEEEILSMVEEGHEQGVIQEDEAEMISNISGL